MFTKQAPKTVDSLIQAFMAGNTKGMGHGTVAALANYKREYEATEGSQHDRERCKRRLIERLNGK